MTVTITWQTIITAGGVLGALGVIIAAIFKFVRWIDRQKKQDEELAALKKKHNEDISALKKLESNDIAEIKQEQRLLTEGILACLKGLSEQGCNGPVTATIAKIEDHLNQQAHV